QRIQGASPEQLVAMLLEGGQRFLKLLIDATTRREPLAQGRYTNRVADIIVELRERLNHEEGGELVNNLIRIYDGWMNVLFDAAMKGDVQRLAFISGQMGEMRETWEELHQRKVAQGQMTTTPSSQAPSLEGLSA
ncbi:MAG: flagellar export chaperone FliS, partial [Firmicutes bacterium]|nr:flagellar export chaperone FliS [Bacillota bacterium]